MTEDELKQKFKESIVVCKYVLRGLKANPALANGGWVEQLETFLKSIRELDIDTTRPPGWICKKCRCIMSLEIKECPECSR